MKNRIAISRSKIGIGCAAASVLLAPAVAFAAPVAITNVTFTLGADYSRTISANPADWVDGAANLDNGLNAAFTAGAPGTVNPPGSVTLGTGQLLENFIVVGTGTGAGTRRDGRAANLGITVGFNADGVAVSIPLVATVLIGNAGGGFPNTMPCFATTNNVGCVDDPAEDFRLEQQASITRLIGGTQYAFSIPAVSFTSSAALNVSLAVTPAAVPEPTPLALVAAGLGVLGLAARRRRPA